MEMLSPLHSVFWDKSKQSNLVRLFIYLIYLYIDPPIP